MLAFRLVSVLMAVLTSNLLIVILTLIFFNETILYKFGLPILGIFCTLAFIRMALPFELTGITINIKFPATISKILTYLQHPRIPFFKHIYSLWELCIFIWIVVFIALLAQYVISIRKTYKFIRNYGTDITDDYIQLIDKICTKEKLKKIISIVSIPLFPVPSVFRHGFNYYIVIPKNLVLNEEERELIFRHELSHIVHHDLTFKFLVELLCMFYWWNPFCSKLKKQSNLLFELHVDSSITAEGSKKIQQYLACLTKVKQYSIDNKSNISLSSAISLLPKQSSVLYKRFYFLTENNKAKSKYLARLVLIPVCILYLASFVFIFEAYYRRPENNDGELLTSTNMYIVKNNENTYDIYFNGLYAETVNSLDNYPKNCKVYSSLEDVQKDLIPE